MAGKSKTTYDPHKKQINKAKKASAKAIPTTPPEIKKPENITIKKIKPPSPRQVAKREREKRYRKERKRVLQLIRRNEKRGIFLNQINAIPPIPKRITEASIRRLQKIDSKYIEEHGTGVDLETGEIISVSHIKRKRRKEADKRREESRRKTRERKRKVEDDSVSIVPGVEELVTVLTEEELRFLEGEEEKEEDKVDITGIIDRIHNADEVTPEDENIWTSEELIIRNFYQFLTEINLEAAAILWEWIDDLIQKYGQQVVGQILIEAYNHGLDFDYRVRYDKEKLMGRIAEFMQFLRAPDGTVNKVINAFESENGGVDADLY